ncbi:peptide chain release factor 2 [Eubacterium sulci ATCC 35585]|nr:peptide chain release factor 2 [Eubacterium sulci ATCC 35585]MBF1139110.1 peptide chain release factor 2 [[Eubacterium] sulci]MBF1172660.1 peptide chain release factor 2 [[Eubacterium] sulci]
MNKQSEQSDFWDDPEKAQSLLKKKKALESTVNEYDRLSSGFKDISEMIEIAEELEDEDEAMTVVENFDELCKDAETFRLKLLLDGKYDSNSAILSIHAGTGGVDAMDWAQMLMRMYTRWADKHGYTVKVVDLQDDAEAGIKSCTMIIDGENAYGYLRREHGVHRLVRISPFNAAGKRQTSFSSVEVMPEMDEDFNIEINPQDLRIDTYRSTGAGGQHVNTTDSAIRITHLPTNIVVTCQNERSQHQNREVAMRILASKLAELAEREHKENLAELKGDFSQITWGSQIRSYVFQPYTMVKDHRTGAEVGNVASVMDGDIDYFINEELKARI